MGTNGTSGSSGLDGTFFGSSGTSGTNATGVAGTSGTSGTTPPNFSSGTSGISGTAGTSGTTPPNFTSGSSGSSGISGTAGTSGTTPPNFTSGTSGTSGVSGTAGTSGTTPPNFSSGTSGISGTSGTSPLGFTNGTSGTSFTPTGTTDNGVLTFDAGAAIPNVESNLTFNGSTLTVTGGVNVTTSVTATTYRETYSDLGTGGSVTIDLATANNFRRTFNATSTVTFSNPPAANAFGFTLVTVNAGAYTITWPASVDWAGGTSPVLTSVGVDVLVFYTYDAGATYYGFVSAKNLS